MSLDSKDEFQIENCKDFIENIVDQTLKIKEECDCCNDNVVEHKVLLTTSEACRHFKVSRPTLKRMRERGEVTYTKYGRNFRYLVEQ